MNLHVNWERLCHRLNIDYDDGPRRIADGQIGTVWRLGPVVVKTRSRGPVHALTSEADGLRALRDNQTPAPIVHIDEPDMLVMDYIASGPPRWEALGRTLALQHLCDAAFYGWDKATMLASVSLPNDITSNWTDFWIEHRLRPLHRVVHHQLGSLNRGIERLLHTFVPPVEGPCLIHGDLWCGNVIMGLDQPYLIDPSVFFGERLVDIAMMKLFGGFPDEMWRAYESIYPIPVGYRDALPYYQLYYVFIHIHLYGASYCGHAQRIIEKYMG